MKRAGSMVFRMWFGALAAFFLFIFPPRAVADDFTSTNFTVKDPVITDGAGYSTSDSFRLWSNVGQISIGSSDATNFGLRSGFLYFPEPSASPTPTPTPSPTPATGTGLGSYLPTPPSPPSVPGLIPILGDFIAQIVGEPPGIVKCGRSDYNCDGKVNLKDLSIFISYPRRVSTGNLSLVFSDWTDRLLRFVPEPAPQFAETSPAAGPRIRPVLRPPLAQVAETVGGEAPPQEIEASAVRKPSIFRRIIDFFVIILRFIGRIFGR